MDKLLLDNIETNGNVHTNNKDQQRYAPKRRRRREQRFLSDAELKMFKGLQERTLAQQQLDELMAASLNRRRRPLKQQQEEQQEKPDLTPQPKYSLADVVKILNGDKSFKCELLKRELDSLLGYELTEADIELNRAADIEIEELLDHFKSEIEAMTSSSTDSASEHEAAAPMTSSSTDAASEHDIEQMLTELSERNIELVSSLDAEQKDRVVHELYMYDKQTGELCGQPLKVPEHIARSLFNSML